MLGAKCVEKTTTYSRTLLLIPAVHLSRHVLLYIIACLQQCIASMYIHNKVLLIRNKLLYYSNYELINCKKNSQVST